MCLFQGFPCSPTGSWNPEVASASSHSELHAPRRLVGGIPVQLTTLSNLSHIRSVVAIPATHVAERNSFASCWSSGLCLKTSAAFQGHPDSSPFPHKFYQPVARTLNLPGKWPSSRHFSTQRLQWPRNSGNILSQPPHQAPHLPSNPISQHPS